MPQAGLIAAGIGAAYKIGTGISQQNKADQVVVPNVSYTPSPYAKAILGSATQLYNGAAPGTAAATGQIYGNESNTTGAIGRNATNGSQALALITGAQGETNKAIAGQAANQEAFKAQQVANLNQANQTMIGEGDKVYQDAVRRQMMAIQEKNALRQSGMQNEGNAINDVSTGISMYNNQALIRSLYNPQQGSGYVSQDVPMGAQY